MSRKPTTTEAPKTEASPAASISPDALQALFDSMAELKATVAKYEAEANAVNSAMTDGPKLSTAGKSDRQLKNEIQCVRAFSKAGIKDAKPHQNVFSYRRWVEKGYVPLEGSKAVKVFNLRLFHVSQVRKLTADEVKAAKEQSKAAVERHEGRGKGTATVVPIILNDLA
jgi:hypothetical protein